MMSQKENPKKMSFVKQLQRTHRSMSKPTGKQLVKGTCGTFVVAVIAALSVSAFDSVFTAIVGLFV